MDDSVQRVFVFWILCLSTYFGNQIAYFAKDYATVKNTLISIYLIIRGSFLVMELFYSIWIPWIRKLMVVASLLVLPAVGLWIAALLLDSQKAVGPAFAAIIWEYTAPLVFETPLGKKLHSHEYQKEVNPVHLRSRMGNFLIIAIGEGVLLLIKGGPLGEGYNAVASLAVWALLIYFFLAYVYFNRDGSIRYIPAVRKKGYRILLWMM